MSVRGPARWLLVVALLGLSVAVWIPRARGPIDLRWDGGAYYVLGTALAEGRGYRLLNEPGDIQAVQYPPLLPLVVAAHQWALGSRDALIVGRWLRVTFFALFVGTVLAAYRLLGRLLPPEYAFVAVVMFVLHVFCMFVSELLFAELPFALASLLFLLGSGVGGSRERPGLAAGAAAVAYLLRTAGIALLAAWVAESVLRRDLRRAALRGAIALVPILGWQAYVASVQAGPSYTSPAYPYQRAAYVFYNVTYAENLALRDPFRPELGTVGPRHLAGRVARNLVQLPPSLGQAVSADWGDWQKALDHLSGVSARLGALLGSRIVPAILTLLGLLVVGGVIALLTGAERLVGLYVVMYGATVCLTPWPAQWRRYWVPLAPLLLLALFRSLSWLARRARAIPGASGRALARIPLPLVAALLLMVEVVSVFQAYGAIRGDVVLHDRQGVPVRFSLFFYGRPDRELDEALEWLSARARPDEVVASGMPHWAYLRTGLKSVVPPFELDPRKAQSLLDAVPVRYLVVDADLGRLMRDSVTIVDDGRWIRIHTSPEGLVAVYERRAAGPPGGSRPPS
jgi:hypothetical protein